MRNLSYAKCQQHPHSLIRVFDISCLDSTIPPVSLSDISGPKLVTLAEQGGFSLTWSQTPKTGFLVTRLII